jgi:hypothetical protein
MLHALYIVLLGMVALFLVQGALYISIILLRKIDSQKDNKGAEV